MVERKRILNSLRTLLFPPKCAACKTLLPWRDPLSDQETDRALCDGCLKIWKSEQMDTCDVCAKRVYECTCMPLPMLEARCSRFYKLIYYDPGKSTPVQNRVIYHIKRNPDVAVHRFLAKQLAPIVQGYLQEKKRSTDQAIITYLPRSRRSSLKYGTDQAEALAKELSLCLGIEMIPLLKRTHTPLKPQKELLTPIPRLKNAQKMFVRDPDKDCRGKTVFIVDDLVTTGSTMSMGTSILRKMGAADIVCLAVASDEINKTSFIPRNP